METAYVFFSGLHHVTLYFRPHVITHHMIFKNQRIRNSNFYQFQSDFLDKEDLKLGKTLTKLGSFGLLNNLRAVLKFKLSFLHPYKIVIAFKI